MSEAPAPGAEAEPPRRLYDLVEVGADYPAWNGPPRRSLLICTTQRSGSTLLGEAIYFAGGLGCPLEYFHGGFRPGFEQRWGATGFRDYLDALYRRRTDPSGVLAVKLFWRDIVDIAREVDSALDEALSGAASAGLEPETYRRIFDLLSGLFPDPVFVRLTRQDQLRQAASFAIASMTRSWRRFADSNPRRSEDADYAFAVMLRSLASVQRENARWTGFFAANGPPRCTLAYEDLQRDYEGTVRRLFEALGRPDAPIAPPRLQKQAGPHSETLLETFLEEFRQRARGD